jgi:hypothetical protein
VNQTHYAVYSFRYADRVSRWLLRGAAGLALTLLTWDSPVAVRAPVTMLLLAAAVVACHRIGRWSAGLTDEDPSNPLHLITAAVVVAASLAVAPALYRSALLLTPVVTVALVDAGVVSAARLHGRVGLGRDWALGIGIAAAAVLAVVAIPRIAGTGGGLTYPTPPSASLSFAGDAADRAAPLPAGRDVRVSVLYTPLSRSASPPAASFGGRRIDPVERSWSRGVLRITYRFAAARSACLTPFVVAAPGGSPGRGYAPDPSRSPLRIVLWVGSSRSRVICSPYRS